MKKLTLTILAGAAVAAACTKFAEDKPIVFDNATVPAVTITAVSDESVEVTVAAAEGTSFFSYAVVPGPAGEVDAASLLKGSYAKNAVAYNDGKAAAVCDYNDVQAVTMTIGGLTPYTEYTVYAVANTAMGSVSEVASATARTTDKTVPALAGYQTQEKDGMMIYAVEFSDPVALTGQGTVTARFFAANSEPDANKMLQEYSSFDLPKECLATEDNYLYALIPASQYIPGAFVFLTYTEGVVANGAGGKNAAYSTTVLSADLKTYKGLIERYKTVAFDLSLTDPALSDGSEGGEGSMEGGDKKDPEPEYFGDWTELVMTAYSAGDYPIAHVAKDAEVTVKAVDGNGRTVTYAADRYGIVADNLVGAFLNEDPGFGVSVSLSVGEGSFEDLFGNYNSEFTAKDAWYCSYGYTLEDVLGTYTVNGYEYDFDSKQPVAFGPESLTIAESNDKTKGNVMITDYFGMKCIKPVYATFNVDAGTLTITEWQVFSLTQLAGADTEDESDDAYAYFYHSSNNEEDLVLKMKEPGVLSEPSDAFGAYIFISQTQQGYSFMLLDIVAAKAESEPAISAASVCDMTVPSFVRKSGKPDKFVL